ncbi:hypothetical protein ACUNE0_12000 [Serratia sp. IR-2025]|uniref:hypothetical protein n=1 Tax=Serratia nevei TaxID=2703794 RepID=UPI0027D2FA9C|nr:hypothetical protein [Serratia nevei]MDR8481199.1 hypothetical protein [Serratia nevei]WMC74981.1 hypothetical protein O8I25_22540 [Serratia nevei]WMC80379.1 hypothetical protein O8I24_22775 [Serratia nevei]
MFLSNRHFISALLALAIGLWLPGSVLARPDLERKIGTTVADSDSADYRFSDLRFTSADGHGITAFASPSRARPLRLTAIQRFISSTAMRC